MLDETFIVQSTGHHLMEKRSAMAYWQNGKLYLHAPRRASRSTWRPSRAGLASAVRRGADLRIHRRRVRKQGRGAVSMAIPALLAKKANAPVMMRISREEESYIGARARTCPAARASASPRTAASPRWTSHRAGLRGMDRWATIDRPGNAASLIYQPGAMRWRAINVITNTPPRTQQRSPGPMQANGIMEPIVTKAAKQLGLDQVAIRRINAPEGKAVYGPPGPNGMRPHATSAFVKEALDRAQVFDWESQGAQRQRRGRCAASARPWARMAPDRSAGTRS